jgi:hypothetical protein
VALAIGALIAPGVAGAAKLDGTDIAGATVTQVDPPATTLEAGGYWNCPDDYRSLAGGAAWHVTGSDITVGGFEDSWLLSSTVTGDQHGWYADGASTASTRSLLIRVVCLPAEKFPGAELRQKTTPIVPRDGTVSAKARCSKGDELITGGAFVHSGSGPTPNNGTRARLGASFPSGRAWIGGVRGFVPFPLEMVLTSYAICMPDGKVADVHMRTSDDTVVPGGIYYTTNGCRKHEAVLGGGAYFHKRGKGFGSGLRSGNLGGLMPTLPAGSGWISAGTNYTEQNRKLKTHVLCIED